MTPKEARDEIMALFVAGWSSTGVDLRFWNAPGPLPKDGSPWARIIIKHTQGGNASISSKRFTRSGIVLLETDAEGHWSQVNVVADFTYDEFLS
jgi:hypothetical protein